MAGTTLDFENAINPDNVGVEIGNRWREWITLREKAESEWTEVRNYLYATDTKTTSNAILPWSNTTTTPKLTQIADNLKANYKATLFPQKDWFRWEAQAADGVAKAKAKTVQAYMQNKLRMSQFKTTIHQIVDDYVDYGNCFGYVSYEKDVDTKETGETVTRYVGGKLHRISPHDVAFNPVAPSFAKAPKIVRSIKSLGELAKEQQVYPDRAEHYQVVLDRMFAARGAIRQGAQDYKKTEGFVADGFSDIKHYYESGYVEVLTFYGDMYDYYSKELQTNRIITVVDRAFVWDNVENPSWLSESDLFHVGWRDRPDNLWAMGPLANLVGLQYRIDHLENLKADVFDQIAYPILKIRGDVEDFDFQPGERIILGEEGDVGYLVPEATALQADLQIQIIEDKMEQFAGAPRETMGIRTPGEKTAFEMDVLQRGSSRIFQNKTSHFEEVFLEPVLNAILETSRRNMNTLDTVGVTDDATGATIFMDITKEDVTGVGKIVPVAARHFAEKARRVQELRELQQVKSSDPSVGVHISGKVLARALTEELDEPELYGENIAIQEELETTQAAQDAEAQNIEDLQIQADEGI